MWQEWGPKSVRMTVTGLAAANHVLVLDDLYEEISGVVHRRRRDRVTLIISKQSDMTWHKLRST